MGVAGAVPCNLHAKATFSCEPLMLLSQVAIMQADTAYGRQPGAMFGLTQVQPRCNLGAP